MCCTGKSVPIKTQVVSSPRTKQPVIIQRMAKDSNINKLTIKRQTIDAPSMCTCGFPMMTVTNNGVSYRKCSNANCRVK
jgi:hypothetical protein